MSLRTLFRDRREAGCRLASSLTCYEFRAPPVVLALPRGGVPVGYEVARRLAVPLDVFVVRKLGAPGQEELALGAIASGGVRVLNGDVLSALRIDRATVDRVTEAEAIELDRRERDYRGGFPLQRLDDRAVVLVDDGLATGASMLAAVAALRARRPLRIVVAVPVGAAESCRAVRAVADDVVCVATPEPLGSVGRWYDDFEQTSDAEVHDLLLRARESRRFMYPNVQRRSTRHGVA